MYFSKRELKKYLRITWIDAILLSILVFWNFLLFNFFSTTFQTASESWQEPLLAKEMIYKKKLEIGGYRNFMYGPFVPYLIVLFYHIFKNFVDATNFLYFFLMIIGTIGYYLSFKTIFKNRSIAFMIAFITFLIPLNFKYFAVLREKTPLGISLIPYVFLFSFISLKERKISISLLTLFTSLILISIKLEHIIILELFLFFILVDAFCRKSKKMFKIFILNVAIFLLFGFPLILKFLQVSLMYYSQEPLGPKVESIAEYAGYNYRGIYSIAYGPKNFRFLKNYIFSHSGLLFIFPFVIFFPPAIKRKNLKILGFITFVFLGYLLNVLSFYAGEERYFINLYGSLIFILGASLKVIFTSLKRNKSTVFILAFIFFTTLVYLPILSILKHLIFQDPNLVKSLIKRFQISKNDTVIVYKKSDLFMWKTITDLENIYDYQKIINRNTSIYESINLNLKLKKNYSYRVDLKLPTTEGRIFFIGPHLDIAENFYKWYFSNLNRTYNFIKVAEFDIPPTEVYLVEKR